MTRAPQQLTTHDLEERYLACLERLSQKFRSHSHPSIASVASKFVEIVNQLSFRDLVRLSPHYLNFLRQCRPESQGSTYDSSPHQTIWAPYQNHIVKYKFRLAYMLYGLEIQQSPGQVKYKQIHAVIAACAPYASARPWIKQVNAALLAKSRDQDSCHSSFSTPGSSSDGSHPNSGISGEATMKSFGRS